MWSAAICDNVAQPIIGGVGRLLRVHLGPTRGCRPAAGAAHACSRLRSQASVRYASRRQVAHPEARRVVNTTVGGDGLEAHKGIALAAGRVQALVELATRR